MIASSSPLTNLHIPNENKPCTILIQYDLFSLNIGSGTFRSNRGLITSYQITNELSQYLAFFQLFLKRINSLHLLSLWDSGELKWTTDICFLVYFMSTQNHEGLSTAKISYLLKLCIECPCFSSTILEISDRYPILVNIVLFKNAL